MLRARRQLGQGSVMSSVPAAFVYKGEKLKNMSAPVVSVIIPVYNAEKNLRQCLDSVLAQTLQDIEVICVDDGSPDNSIDILREYAGKDSRVVVVPQENGGAGAARNHGLRVAKGKYLSFLDADDFFEPEMLEDSVKKLEEDGSDFVVFRCDQYVDGTGQFRDGKYVKGSGTYRNARYALRTECMPPYMPFSFRNISGNVFKSIVGWAWDKVYTRSFVERYELTFQEQRTTNDMRFVFLALVLADKISYIDKVYAHQRREDKKSLSNSRSKSWHCFHDALISLKENLEKHGLYEELERDYICYCLHASLWNLSTLGGEARTDLYNKLRDEWFEEFGINAHASDKAYFFDQGEYQQYREIMERPADEWDVKLSVVIPIYNKEAFLKQTLLSVLTHQMDGIEVICVDDHSTDRSPQILKEFARKYPNLKVITNESNQHAGIARNIGLEAAKGRYVHFLDADDMVKPGAYQEIYRLCCEMELDWIKTASEVRSVPEDAKRPAGSRIKELAAFQGRRLQGMLKNLGLVFPETENQAAARAAREKAKNAGKQTGENFRYTMAGIPLACDAKLMDFREFPRKFLDKVSVVPWNALYKRSFLMEKGIRFNDNENCNDRTFFTWTCLEGERIALTHKVMVVHTTGVKDSLSKGIGHRFDNMIRSYHITENLLQGCGASEKLSREVLAAELRDIEVWETRAAGAGVLDPSIREKLQDFREGILRVPHAN